MIKPPSSATMIWLKAKLEKLFAINYIISSIIFSEKQKQFSEGENHMRRMFGFLIGIMVGALVGSTVALLLAPESGEQLRGELRDRGQGFMNEIRHASDSRRIELRGRLETLRAPREPMPQDPPVM
jgi:uncharacterized protein YebE (UPF0316 family)